MPFNTNINSVQDYEDVISVVAGYVNGLKTGSVAELKKTFHDDAAGGNFTDYHSVIKIDGKWKVVAKLFHLYEK